MELSGTRVLEGPVSYSEGGIAFEVTEFVASPDETFIFLKITGLSESVFPVPDQGLSGVFDTIYIQWDGAGGQRSRLSGHILRASVSQKFPEGDSSGDMDEGIFMKVAFGPLPPEITQVRVEWLPYRIIPNTDTNETWTLNIPLDPISVENAEGFFHPGYSPPSAEDTQHDIKLIVEDVYTNLSGTVIDASIVAPEPASYAFARDVVLSTDTGYQSGVSCYSADLDMIGGPIYKVTPDVPRATTIRLWPVRWCFDPVDAQSSQMILEVGSLIIRFYTRDWFEIEIDPDPEVGLTIPLDIQFDIEGFPLQIYQARVIMAPAVIDGNVRDFKSIEFLADNTLTTDGKRLSQLVFCPYDKMLIADAYASGGFVECGQWLPIEPDLIKDGKIRVGIDMVEIEQVGPWVISWDVP